MLVQLDVHQLVPHHFSHVSNSSSWLTIHLACACVTSSAKTVSRLVVGFLHHFHHLLSSVLLNKLISTHVTTTNSDDKLSVDNLCQNLPCSKKIFTWGKSFYLKCASALVQVVPEQFIDWITLNWLVGFGSFDGTEIPLQRCILVLELSSSLIDIPQLLEKLVNSLSVSAVDSDHVVNVIWLVAVGNSHVNALSNHAFVSWLSSVRTAHTLRHLLSFDSGLFNHSWKVIVEFPEADVLLIFELNDEFHQLLNFIHIVYETISLLSKLTFWISILFLFGGILLKFLIHELEFFLQVIREVFEQSINLSQFLISPA